MLSNANYVECRLNAPMNSTQPFLNDWLDFNENLEVGNLDPLVHILQLTYCKTFSHLSQNAKIAQLEHFIYHAQNYNFIQFKTTCILYLASFLSSK